MRGFKRLTFVLLLTLIWLLLFFNVSYAAVNKNQKQIEIKVEMSPSDLPFAGFIATLGQNGNVNIKRFTDPALFAQMTNMRIDEVLNPPIDEEGVQSTGEIKEKGAKN